MRLIERTIRMFRSHTAPPIGGNIYGSKPGIQMGDIDTMSRIPDGQHPTSQESSRACPTLTPDKWWDAEDNNALNELFILLDPNNIATGTRELHTAYQTVYHAVQNTLNDIQR